MGFPNFLGATGLRRQYKYLTRSRPLNGHFLEIVAISQPGWAIRLPLRELPTPLGFVVIGGRGPALIAPTAVVRVGVPSPVRDSLLDLDGRAALYAEHVLAVEEPAQPSPSTYGRYKL